MKGQGCLGDVNTKTECGIYLEILVLNCDAGKARRGQGCGSKGSKRHAPVFLATREAEAGGIVV